MSAGPARPGGEPETGNEAVWRAVFAEGHPELAQKRWGYSILPAPADARCPLCYAPLGGFGGWVARRAAGVRASPRNPRFCGACDRFLESHPGGAEVPISLLFCDVRDSVGLSLRLGPRRHADLVARVRRAVAEALWPENGFLLEFQGDAVVALWPPGLSGPGHAAGAVRAARAARAALLRLAAEADAPPGFAAGLGVHTGTAYLCTLSRGPGLPWPGIGAFGGDVNIAARLADAARGGEALATEDACRAAGLAGGAAAAARAVELKGVPGRVRVLSLP